LGLLNWALAGSENNSDKHSASAASITILQFIVNSPFSFSRVLSNARSGGNSF